MQIKQLIKGSSEDEFEIAATVCLHIKTLILMNERLSARTKLEQFLSQNTILYAKGKLPVKGKVTPESKKYFLNKLNLISTLASLKHSLEMSPVDLYIMYT